MFFQQALNGKNDWWIYLLTILGVMLAYFIGQVPLDVLLDWKIGNSADYSSEMKWEFYQNPDFNMFGISRNLGFVMLLLMFFTAFLMLLALVKNVHKKSLISLINAYKKINFRKIGFGFGFWLAIAIVFEGIYYFTNPDTFSFHFNASNFIILFVITLTLLPIQTSFEELFFRGYLMQGISIATKNKWIPLILTSVIFGLIHSYNPEVLKYGFWPMQMYYMSAGLILGIMTIMDDSLELALGVHFATNFFAATFVSYEGAAIQTDTLYKTSEVDPFSMFIAMAAGGLIFLFVCSKKYSWKSFKTIFDKINYDNEEHLASIPS